MSCPDADTLLLDHLGELPVNRSEALRAHVQTCGRCAAERAELARMIEELAPAKQASDDGAAFTARVLAAARGVPQARREVPARRRSRLAFATGTLAAAAAAVWLVAGPRARPPVSGQPEPPIAGTVTARGGAAPGAEAGERLSAEILLVREGRLQPLRGAAVHRSDALAVRVTNLSGSDAQLMAFAWDAAGDVHWLYPAYLDARTNPRSVPIAAGARDRLLSDIVQPDAPHVGPLRMVTLVAQRPLTVKEVEARLATTPPRAWPTADIAALFPGVIAREWPARWEADR
ncbi:MAG TPA: hypothetical protein VMT03_26685 [Polyangia bacterium]|nr:hypothetical protein [Polyangia bacterium]